MTLPAPFGQPLPLRQERRSIASPSSTVFWNFLAVGSGEAIARIVAFAGLLYVARNVGAAGYGVVAFAAGVTLYLTKIADFGIETIGTVEIARHRDEIPRLASAILTLRLGITTLLTVAMIAVALLFLPEPDRTVFAVFALTLPPIAASTKWIHIGLEAARPVGIWRVIGEVITLILILMVVRDTSHLWRVPAANVIGDVVGVAVLYWLLRRRHYRVRFLWDPERAAPVFKSAIPMVAQIVAVLFIYNSGVIFLRVLRTPEIVGYYAAAYTLLSFTENICTLYGMTLLPTLTRLGKKTLEERTLYHTALAQVFAVALPVSVGGMFLAPEIIRLAFGAGYSSSGVILQVLIWAVLPYALRVVPCSALIAHGHQRLAWRATAYAVVANLGLNLLLIQAYGGLGAAVATIATEILAGGLTFYYSHRQGLSIAALSRFSRPALGAATMSAVLWLAHDLHFGLQLATGAITYALVLFSLGALRFRGAMPILAV
jgi:O-antigen/teichoic acid export membrane protein